MATSSTTSQATSNHEQVILDVKSTFKQQIYVKYDGPSYLQWKKQVVGVICDTKMIKYVSHIKFLNDSSSSSIAIIPLRILRTQIGKNKILYCVLACYLASLMLSYFTLFFFVSVEYWGQTSCIVSDIVENTIKII